MSNVIKYVITGDAKGIQSAFGDISSAADGAESGMGSLALGAVAGFAAIGVAVGASVKALYDLGAQFDEVDDNLRAKLGLTGDDLKGAGESIRAVYGQVPESLDEVGGAFVALKQKTDYSNEALTNLTTQAANLSHVIGGDATEHAKNFGVSLSAWNVPADQAGGKMDFLFKVTQKTGANFDDLSKSLAENEPLMKQAGYSYEQGALLLGKLEKEGLSAGDANQFLSKAAAQAAAAHKPLALVIEDYKAKITASYKATGDASLAAELFGKKAGPAMAEKIASGKLSIEDLAKEVESSTDTINQATSDTADGPEKLSVAWHKVQLALEPVAAAIFNGVSDLITKMGPYIDMAIIWFRITLPQAIDVIKQYWDRFSLALAQSGISWQGIMQTLQGVWGFIQTSVIPVISTFYDLLYKVAVQVAQWFADNWPAISRVANEVFAFIQANVLPMVQKIADYIGQKVTEITTFIQNEWPKISEAIGHVMNVIWGIIEKVWGAIQYVWEHYGNNIMGVVNTVWDQIKNTIDTVVNIIKNIIDLVLNVINGDWGAAWDNIKNIFGAVWDWIVNTGKNAINMVWELIKGIGSFIGDTWSNIWGGISNFFFDRWNAMLDFFKGLPSTISNAVSGLWNGLKQGLVNVLNWLIDKWNGFADSMQFDLPGIGHVGLPKINGHIPALAAGGNILRGGLSWVGEKGPELLNLPQGASVTPLSAMAANEGDTYVFVEVKGSVTAEKDLALKVRDVLVKEKQRNGTTGL